MDELKKIFLELVEKNGEALGLSKETVSAIKGDCMNMSEQANKNIEETEKDDKEKVADLLGMEKEGEEEDKSEGEMKQMGKPEGAVVIAVEQKPAEDSKMEMLIKELNKKKLGI